MYICAYIAKVLFEKLLSRCSTLPSAWVSSCMTFKQSNIMVPSRRTTHSHSPVSHSGSILYWPLLVLVCIPTLLLIYIVLLW